MNDKEFTTDMSIKEAVIAYAAEAEQAGMNPKNNLVSAEMPHGMGAAMDSLYNAELLEGFENKAGTPSA